MTCVCSLAGTAACASCSNNPNSAKQYSNFITWTNNVERTCRIVEYDEAPFPVCSECGAVQPDDFTVYYCWNCGARVVDGKEGGDD